jgi:hypothetical protein
MSLHGVKTQHRHSEGRENLEYQTANLLCGGTSTHSVQPLTESLVFVYHGAGMQLVPEMNLYLHLTRSLANMNLKQLVMKTEMAISSLSWTGSDYSTHVYAAQCGFLELRLSLVARATWVTVFAPSIVLLTVWLSDPQTAAD